MTNKSQRFQRFDHVCIASDLGPTMRHFRNGCEAIVLGSYRDLCGGHGIGGYSVHLKDGGPCAWYEEWQLTLLQSNQRELLEEWERQDRETERSKAGKQ